MTVTRILLLDHPDALLARCAHTGELAIDDSQILLAIIGKDDDLPLTAAGILINNQLPLLSSIRLALRVNVVAIRVVAQETVA